MAVQANQALILYEYKIIIMPTSVGMIRKIPPIMSLFSLLCL